MRIAFVYAGGRESRWKEAMAGQVPTDFFYGAVELARSGHDIECMDAPDAEGSLQAMLYNYLLDWRTPVRTRGDHVVSAGRLLARLQTANVVVAASTAHANALAIWKGLGRLRAPLVGIHCGHVNFQTTSFRRKETTRVLGRQEIVLFADAEAEETVRQFGVEPSRIHANAYGVDTDFWTPAEVGREFILAVGNDGRRDYGTLVKAVEGIGADVKIVTARALPSPLPPHVEHIRGSWHRPAVTDEQLRDLYRRALFVVVPLEDSIQPSGQSVALQAMSCGRPVILSRTRGLWTGDALVADRDLLLVENGSSERLRSAMRRLLDDAALREQIGASAREAACRSGNIRHFAARLNTLVSSLKC